MSPSRCTPYGFTENWNPFRLSLNVSKFTVNSIEATAHIKEHLPNINVVIQTVFDDDDYIFRAICNGASGYLLKNIGPEKYLDS